MNLKKLFISAIVCLGFALCSYAQDGAYGSYSPYTIFGIGDLSYGGSSYNNTMGGVGICTRNKRFINSLNPAAITARDSLSFMVDYFLSGTNTIFTQNDLTSASNTFTLANLVMSFPIWRSSALMVGIAPLSNTGYDFASIEEDQSIIGKTGNIAYQNYGQGSIYQIFLGAGATFWKRLSVGAEFIFYMGTIDKHSNVVFSATDIRPITGGYNIAARAFTGKFGLQYEQKLGKKSSIILGATYRMETNMLGENCNYKYAILSEIIDTTFSTTTDMKDTDLKIAGEWGVGISYKFADKWSLEFNYLRSDWTTCAYENYNGFKVTTVDGNSFSTRAVNSYRLGFEISPSRNDTRYYFRRCSYRAGIVWEQAYYTLKGYDINKRAISLGMTFPINKLYNGITIGLDVGSRGTLQDSLVREFYTTINVGFNIHDIWFQKQKYN